MVAAPNSSLMGVTLLMVCGMFWGLTPSLSKMAVAVEAHPVGLSLLQNILGTTVCSAICWLRGTLRWPTRAEMKFYLCWAVLYSVINQVLVYWLVIHVEATVISVVMVLEGFAVFAVAAVTRTEAACWRRGIGLGIGLIGTMILFTTRFSVGFQGGLAALCLALVVPFTYAAEDVYVGAKRPHQFDPFLAFAFVTACSVPMLLAITVATHDVMPLHWPVGRVEIITLLIVSASLGAYTTYLALISWAGPVFAGQVAYSTALCGIGWSAFLLGEQVSWTMLASLTLVIIGLFLVRPQNVAPRRAPEEPAQTSQIEA